MNIKSFLAGKIRKLILLCFDLSCFVLIAAGYYVANLLLDQSIKYDFYSFLANSGILFLSILVVRFALGVYGSVLRYTRTLNYLKMIISDITGCVAAVGFSWLCRIYEGVWFFVTITSLYLVLELSSRYAYRLLYKMKNRSPDYSEMGQINVAIVGAGQLGAMLANELLYKPHSVYKPVMFIEKSAAKCGNTIGGITIYPEDENIYEVIKKHNVREIFIAISEMDNETATRIFEFYSKSSCKLKVYDIPIKDFKRDRSERVAHKIEIRNFEIDDLLFRSPLKINNIQTASYYYNKVVLITGGGGSIGSELCRQIAKCSPKKLIVVDIYENNAYDIQQELVRKYGDRLDLCVEIASVRDIERLDSIFNYYRPQIVFHAAAHKHVPLMEHSGCEAIKNNIFGTKNTADAAEKYGVEKFILISTDKAVNPTNIMGASKRMCEMIVQSRTDSVTSFAAVRFGNVLGSNGSVIPLFKHQIEQGGPVTITDKRIIRYFMTIPEASQLVMEAGAMAKSGELFVLDMGKPIKIYDLAVNMIKLSGYEPEVDIKIKEIGLRPGEKLYEELLIKTEDLTKTSNNMIFIENDTPLSREEIEERLLALAQVVKETKDDITSPAIKNAIKEAVPTFVDPEEINKDADDAPEMAEAMS